MAVYLGIGWSALALVLSFFFLFDARDKYCLSAEASNENAAKVLPLPGLTIGQAWRDTSPWRIAASTVLLLAIPIAISVHQFPVLVEAGIARDHAAWLLSLFGIAAVFGKIITGWLIDRFHGRWVGGIIFTLVGTEAATLPGWLERQQVPMAGASFGDADWNAAKEAGTFDGCFDFEWCDNWLYYDLEWHSEGLKLPTPKADRGSWIGEKTRNHE